MLCSDAAVLFERGVALCETERNFGKCYAAFMIHAERVTDSLGV